MSRPCHGKTTRGIGPVSRLLPLLLLITVALFSAHAGAAGSLKVGVLKFGSANWQLRTVTAHGLDKARGITVEIVAFASKNATSVAFQAGAVDLIVSDWIWALRQRNAGADFRFVPYTTMFGAVMTPPDSGITGIADLAGKRIGVAGGPIDKSWLLLRAWSRQSLGYDIADKAIPVFAAPPLLTEQMRRGRLDGILAFWPDAARLEAAGYRAAVPISRVLDDLGIAAPVSLVGYVFHDPRDDGARADLEAFFAAVRAADRRLANDDKSWDDESGDDEIWRPLRPSMAAQTDAAFEALKQRFRAGIPAGQSINIDSARKLFGILHGIVGDDLAGKGARFDPALFYAPTPRPLP